MIVYLSESASAKMQENTSNILIVFGKKIIKNFLFLLCFFNIALTLNEDKNMKAYKIAFFI